MEKSGLFNSTANVPRAYQAFDFALPLGALAGGRSGIMMGIGNDFLPEKLGSKSIKFIQDLHFWVKHPVGGTTTILLQKYQIR